MVYSIRRAGDWNPSATNIGNTMAAVITILCPICHKENERRPNARFCKHCGHDIILNNDSPSDHRRYYITRVIKQGGQGAVYEGIDAEGRVYAIKEMLDRFTNQKERDEALGRFNSEANLLQGLSHPRIPRVYSHFADEGRHYLTMDFVRGEDLEQIVQREGVLPEAKVLEWADQICDVLGYLHSRGLIYRDMKPSNVMIEQATGMVKLIDFGITRIFKPTERGTQIGTPGYAPPEQYQGFATPASDIYALAATLHHLLTGRDPTEEAPFSFPPARNVNVHVSRRTSDALEQALQMKPENRFGTVAEFRAMLRPLAAAQATQVRVAPQTVALPGAARPAAAPPPRPAGNGRVAQAAPQRPAPPAPVARPAPAPPSAPARPARTPSTPPAGSRRRRVWPGRLLALLIVLIGIAVFIYTQYPGVVRQYLPDLPSIEQLIPSDLPSIEQIVPQVQPSSAVPVTQQISLEVEVLLPSDADDATILNALRNEYESQIKAQYGSEAMVNLMTVSPVGSWTQEIEDNGQVSYQATMQGFVQRP